MDFKTKDHAAALIQVQDVSLVAQKKLILDQISFDVYPHEILTIVGPNGAGKTSLLRLMLRLNVPSQGQIMWRPGLSLGYVPQQLDRNPMLPMTVERFIRLFHPHHEIAADWLEKVGLNARHLSKSMHVLSGGELQRVLLAQAVLGQPQVLLLDEPTRGIDVRGQMDVYAWLLELKSNFNMSIVLVSHDLHLVMAKTDRVLCLNRHLCCAGHPTVVAQDPAYLALYHHHHNHQHTLEGDVV